MIQFIYIRCHTWCQHRGKLCSEPQQCLFHRHCWHRQRNSTGPRTNITQLDMFERSQVPLPISKRVLTWHLWEEKELSPGVRGSRSWASRRDDRPGREVCTPAQFLESRRSLYLGLCYVFFLEGCVFSSFYCHKVKRLTKPGMVVFGLLHHLGALLPLVRLRLLLVVLVRLAHYHDVLASPDVVGQQINQESQAPTWRGRGRTWLGAGRCQSWTPQPGKYLVKLTFEAKSNLVAWGAVIVPNRQVGNWVGILLQSFCLRPQTLACSVDPDVKSLDPEQKMHLM